MAESKDTNAEHARTAAQIDADVGVEHVASVYAEALLGASEKAECTPAIVEEFDLLLSDVLRRNPKLETILASVLISHEETAGIIDRVVGSWASPMLANFLIVVSRHGRLGCLRAIHRQLHALYDKLRGRIRVQLTTAMPLSDTQVNRVAGNLRSALGGEPVLTSRADPNLIGGAIVRVGDTVYDGSIANQLKMICDQMIDRSVHEIQSRRDRFRNPAGD